jgi:long-chain acyl-CoA synthetase
MAEPPHWYGTEAEYTDAVVGDDTLGELFAASARRNADIDAQRYKGGVYDRSLAGGVVPEPPAGEYTSISYERMAEVVSRLAAGFRALGVAADSRVGIFASTRMEWALSDFALLSAEAVVTTVYTDSSPERVRYLLSDPGAEAVVVGTEAHLERVLAAKDELSLSFVVVMDDIRRERNDVITLAEVYERGCEAFEASAYESWLAAREPEDLASIIYTSGTTGEPKGVCLTHRNFRSNINQTRKRLGPRPDKDPALPTLEAGMSSIAFLPLAHVLERLGGHFFIFASGGTVGYAESAETLAGDFERLRPNFGVSVPRVYERIFRGMREETGDSAVKTRLFRWAIDVAKRYSRADDPGPRLRAQHALADRLVYETVRTRLGGEIEFLVSGGGTLSKSLCETFLGMGITIIEGYGLTETSPVVTINPPEDIRPGTLGMPVTEIESRVDESVVETADFPEADGPVGELLLAGPNVTEGYWRKPEATERAFTELDGRRWLRTGDVVERTDDGFLVYHDRLKQLLVLSTGKNVAPQPIESLFATRDRVEQIMVVGDGRKFVGALIVPDFETIAELAEKRGVDLPADRAAQCDHERVREWVGETVADANAELERVERIKEFELVPTEWTVDNDLLTPSMKKKRHSIAETFEGKLRAIYEE